ncbi:MAG TPA: diaminopimelate dehydrogenase [Desulfitobacterium dehalogenans]|uniref:Meso-diaminopimelate D-dehydrogenase n=1 Tax=Desulfitobacterium dehalogenans TaxID=36854 RepID=A0A7C7D7H1_9FIRM|nr:diaminopimelate dehydrogenase [Desulfitobacterium dehalogenans]
MNKIRMGIVGYGNLGQSVELGIHQNEDMELVGVFTRRDPATIKTVTEGVNVFTMDEAKQMTDQIDVMVLCGGSMSDMPVQGPEFAGLFNTVDGYDTHAKIPEYFAAMNKNALDAKKVCIIASGWDPGMFSINRLYAEAILPEGNTYTFWGKGISQGHSDAIRRVKGVKDAKQYTIPKENAIEAVRRGEMPELTTREKHGRECFVVVEEGADKAQIEHEIKTMPNYFADYDTEVHFITEEELEKNHHGLPHGGLVIRHGRTGLNEEHNHVIEYRLDLDSNPNFTANVLVAFARAAYRLNHERVSGAKTVVDIAPAYLSSKSAEELRKTLI